jgi:hypothetical protein
MLSVYDLLVEEEEKKGFVMHERRVHRVSVRLPPHSSVSIPISLQFPSLFEGVPPEPARGSKEITWAFDLGEVTAEAQDGRYEVEELHVQVLLDQRVYPSRLGRLLSYENESHAVANVATRQIFTEEGLAYNVLVTSEVTSTSKAADVHPKPSRGRRQRRSRHS